MWVYRQSTLQLFFSKLAGRARYRIVCDKLLLRCLPALRLGPHNQGSGRLFRSGAKGGQTDSESGQHCC
jgi:hypothetical protein